MADLKTSVEQLNVGESDQQWPQKVSRNSRRLKSLAGFAQQRFNRALVIPLFDLFWRKVDMTKYEYQADPRIFFQVGRVEEAFPETFGEFGLPVNDATALFSHMQSLFAFDDVTDDEMLAELKDMAGPDGGFMDFVDIKFRVRKTKEPVVFDLLQTGLNTYSIAALGSIDKVLIDADNEVNVKNRWWTGRNAPDLIYQNVPTDKYGLKSWVPVQGVEDVRSIVPGDYGELLHEFWNFDGNMTAPASFEMVVTV